MAEITWYGHACFRLKGKDATIITDPYDRSLGLGTLGQKADIVTISHDHPHHNAISAVKGEPFVTRGPGEYEVRGMFITGVWSYADDQKGKVRGRNTIFLFHLGDLVVCHLGSLGHTLNSQQVEAIGDVDVLLVPIGENTTLTTTKAIEVITQIEPKIVVPMHYEKSANGNGGGGDADALAKFAKEMGLKDWQVQDKLSVKGSDLPETTHVVVLEAKS
ncbi:MAG TPA: MBL fold metallo-hydrolase [Chloroflexia bacterium]|nr:MBL fold metallo-hydrolase [Chloroflexia bacterium]